MSMRSGTIGTRVGTIGLVIFAATVCGCDRSGDGDGDGRQGEPIQVAAVPDDIEVVEAPTTGVSLGWGWNKGDHEPIPTICVEFVEGEERAQTRFMTMTEVSDSYEVMQSMGMSAEASVKTIGFKAEGKAAFAKSLNVNAFSNTFVMNAEVHNGVRFAAPSPDDDGAFDDSRLTYRGGLEGEIRLTEHAVRLASKRNLDDFKRSCGTAFVSAIYGGAKLTAVITTKSSSRSAKQSESATLSGGGWGARFEGHVEKKDETTASNESMELSLFQTGGSGDAIPVSKEDLFRKLEVLSLEAYTAPKDFSVALTPYEILSNWPSRGMPDRATEFDELASYWGGYNTLYDEIEEILDQPLDFASVSLETDGCVRVDDGTAPDATIDPNKIRALQQEFAREIASGNVRAIREFAKRLRELEASAAVPGAVDNSANIAALRKAQDEVLAALRKMQDVARDCVSKSDTCFFKASDYRSPYAFRLQLLPPIGFATSSKDIIEIFVEDSAKRRCAISPDNAGCISNAEIDGWQEKIGLTPVHKADDSAFYDVLSRHLTNPNFTSRTVCDNGTLGAPAISVERDQEILWVNRDRFPGDDDGPAQ